MLALVERLNADPAMHGMLVQLPLPKAISTTRVLEAIAPHKDVDGFHPINVGLLAIGEFGRALLPCTPAGAMILIDRACAALGRKLDGEEAVIVGRSNIVGKPMAQLLLARNCTVTIAHSRTRDLPAVARRADILVAAVGKAEMVRGDWVKPGAIVIDVGINRVPAGPTKRQAKTRLVGDVAYAEAAARAGAITPVPGGVGPMTIAMLMANTLIAACRASGGGGAEVLTMFGGRRPRRAKRSRFGPVLPLTLDGVPLTKPEFRFCKDKRRSGTSPGFSPAARGRPQWPRRCAARRRSARPRTFRNAATAATASTTGSPTSSRRRRSPASPLR